MPAVLGKRNPAVIALALLGAAIALLVLRFGPAPSPAKAASHREAPLISNDPPADITDFYMFRSTEAGQGDKVDLLMDVIPFEEPSGGPNYYNFDPSVAYTFHVDNDRDGRADDVVFKLRFTNEIRGAVSSLGLPLSYVGGVPPSDGSVIPPITSLDSPGLGLRQHYTVTMIKNGHSTVLSPALDKIAVPSNVGPRTMPSYDSLAAQGMYDLGGGVRVFAGQRDDPFFIDLGAAFDTLNLRSPATDMLSGFNVNTIALEVPASMLTRDRKDPGTTSQPWLGAYASTSRPKVTTTEDEATLGFERRLVQQALAQLTPEQREALELGYYGGLTQSELAERLGQPLGTVKSRMFTGLSRLRDLLAQAGLEGTYP